MENTQVFKTVTTNLGRNAIALAHATGQKIKLTHMAVGDANGEEFTPLSDMSNLKREVYRAQLSDIFVDETRNDQFTAELIIPQDVGGFFIREVGVFMEDGTLFAIANTPVTEKTELSAGSATDLVIRMVIRVLDAECVEIFIDPAQVLVTRDYVDRRTLLLLDEHDKNPDAHQAAFEKQKLIGYTLEQRYFQYPFLPPSWYHMDGSLIVDIDTKASPKALAFLLEYADFYLIGEAEWHQRREDFSEFNVGGVTKFVYNQSANTLRLPDLRGLNSEAFGFDGLQLGGAHGDMIRNLRGSFDGVTAAISFQGFCKSYNGGTFQDGFGITTPDGTGGLWSGYLFDTSFIVPTGKANKTRAIGEYRAVYLG